MPNGNLSLQVVPRGRKYLLSYGESKFSRSQLRRPPIDVPRVIVRCPLQNDSAKTFSRRESRRISKSAAK